KQQPPTALKVVAVLFVISGIFAVLEILVSLIDSTVSFNLGVLCIPVGRGLLRFRPGWRTCALVLTWFAIVFAPVFAILALDGQGTTYFALLGVKVGYAPRSEERRV